ncbi:NADH:ubiquinone oxidoreductase subunit F (NADH-binding)/ferredoxin [Nocardiopsis mwathae]|uniref:NADH:ubiquinone oxidoreductase subunit F (NADH-binding)/ferredoxin n=1 Tax=Nocardiopsis mwathae TaxID=1472723 RepID=A0A7W9YK00_9ACTN|nr:NADH-quinone oxidoreductase subunit NuoF family protein [Nocardiopsis mwathae]MBB6173573.1 NADH:ubiquinone oxidoreductase subunit F (NADH-binding)/ferredoxin [Nocardiopsis mwathae]
MTSVAPLGEVPPVRAIGTPRLTLGLDSGRGSRLDFLTHQALHGDMPRLNVDDLMTMAGLADLRGRGGAGFPFARKLQAAVRSAERRGTPVRVVVNATEGEPAAAKDLMLLTRAPHLILDGAELTARALNAPEITIGIACGEAGEKSLLDAIDERDSDIAVQVVRMPDRFISGEGGSLVRGINGQVPIPPGRKVRASDRGVDGLPTVLSNAETYAQLSLVAALGADQYATVGLTSEPGTVLLSVSGSAKAPAVVECPSGTPLSDVLVACHAPVGRGVLMGGYHGKWLRPDAVHEAVVSRAGMEAVGSALGAGVVVPLGDDSCPLEETALVLHYMARESAMQCGPCFRGLPELARAFDALVDGEADPEDVQRAAAIGNRRGACSHPDGTARMALSALEAFPDDVAAHRYDGGCGTSRPGVLPLPKDDSGRRLVLDWSRCDGHGLCARLAPELIQLDRNGFPESPTVDVPVRSEDAAAKAVQMCPSLALRLESPPPL